MSLARHQSKLQKGCSGGLSSQGHQPVMLAEVLALVPAEACLVVDCTVGGGGHAAAIIEKLGAKVELVGFDRDVEALAIAHRRLQGYPNRVRLLHGSYAEIDKHLGERAVGTVDFALLDLGISSLQLERSGSGFSFQALDEPLDLRFDCTAGKPAAKLLSEATPESVTKALRQYGEVDRPRQIALDIVQAASKNRLNSVADLVKVLSRHVRGEKRNQFLAKVWQALRIWVNDELAELRKGLEQLPRYMRPGGVIAAITFHSLEDRLVKRFFLSGERPCVCPREFPVCLCGRKPTLERVLRRAVRPTAEEIARNPRARSAKLRAARKVALST